MRRHVRTGGAAILAVVLAIGTAACGSDAAATSTPAPPAATKAAPPARPKIELSADFRPAAERVRQFVGETLSQAMDETTHDGLVAEARQQLDELRGQATTDADRNVTLLLGMFLTKDSERKRLTFLSKKGFSDVRLQISALVQEREVCNSEIQGWLGNRPTTLAALQNGKCLTEAQQAAGISGR